MEAQYEEEGTDLSDSLNSVAFTTLDQYVQEGLVQPRVVLYQKEQYAKLNSAVLATYIREKVFLKRAQNLNNDLLSEKIKLEKESIRHAEDASQVVHLKKEKAKALAEVTECVTRDSALAHEVAEMQHEHVAVLKLRNDIVSENTSTVEPMISEATKEINNLIYELSKTEEVLTTQSNHQKEYTSRLEVLEAHVLQLDDTVLKARKEYQKVSNDPSRLKRQGDVVEKATKNVKTELQKYEGKLSAQTEGMKDQELKKFESESIQSEMDDKLSIHREAIEHHQREVDREAGKLQEEKNVHHDLVEARMHCEFHLQNAEDEARRSNDLLNNTTKELDRVKKSLKKKQMLTDIAKSLLPNLKDQVTDTLHSIHYFQEENKSLNVHQKDLKQEVDVYIAKFLKQEGIEKNTKMELVTILSSVKELESELAQWGQEEVKQNRLLSVLVSQREIKAREASQAMENERETVQTVKMKELVLYDLAKKCNDTNNKLKEFVALYDIVKNERNNYVNLIQSSTQALAEMKEKIKILQNELDVLRNEGVSKDKALSKEKLAHSAAKSTRDSLRLDSNKFHVLYREKQRGVEAQIVEIDKLNSIINIIEKNMLRLKKQYESAVDDRNFTGVQLIDRNDELCILYEKSNIQDDTLKKGEIALREKEQALRMVRITINEKKRILGLKRAQMPRVPEYALKIVQLAEELKMEQQMSEMLCRDLEAPKNTDRWRALGGEDPGEPQLQAKIDVLQNRMHWKKEQLLEKELILDEVSTLATRLRDQAAEGRDETLAISQRVNECQSQIKDVTRKMMATVSELSMFQATAMKLQQEKSDRSHEMEEAKWNVSQGRCPNAGAEAEWHRRERERVRIAEHDPALSSTQIPKHMARTTAEPRPNAYVPEEQGLPKPYGGQAPFKPTNAGATMRHIRRPEQQDIEI